MIIVFNSADVESRIDRYVTFFYKHEQPHSEIEPGSLCSFASLITITHPTALWI